MTGFFIDHLWLVPVLPLFGALVIMVLGRRLGEPKAGWLASFMTIGSFLITVAALLGGSIGLVAGGILVDSGWSYGTVMLSLVAGPVIASLIVWFRYPETAHLDLDEISHDL